MSVLLALSGGCKLKFGAPSKVKESPDPANNPQNLGIGEGPFKWADLKNATSATIEHPWADTYWPLQQRGLAVRWMADGDSNLSSVPKTLYEALAEVTVAESEKTASLHYLSPGEKYDLLVGSTTKISSELLEKIKADDELYKTKVLKDLEPLTKVENELNKSIDDAVHAYRELAAKAKDLAEQITKAQAEKEEVLAGKLRSELDGHNTKLDELEKKVIELDKQVGQNRFAQRQAAKDYYAGVEKLAEEAQSVMPMTAESWKTWAYWEGSAEENYGWMGHCHGWAPASLMEKRPQRSVLAEKDGKKILFTEGDIRGLLTKVWSDQTPEKGGMQGARRCNAATYDVDYHGRILDGTICYDKTDGSCDVKSGKPFYMKNNGIERGFITFTESMHATEPKIAVVDDFLGNENYKMFIFPNLDDFNIYIDSKGKTKPASMKDAVMHVTSSCRDVNPMTLHLALTKLLHEKKTGFVIDVTRSAEVWNQPVYKYELEYLPIILNKKDPSGATSQSGGEPALLADINDPFADYRALGTHSLVVVQAKIYYALENGPKIDYDRNQSDDRNAVMNVTYTLEFDKDQNLIGGEWGAVPLPGGEQAHNKEARFLIGGDAPDFIWYFAKGSKLKKEPFQMSIIRKIHACSLRTASGKMKMKEVDWENQKEGKPAINEVEVEYVDCKL